jgi:hypothetical protein
MFSISIQKNAPKADFHLSGKKGLGHKAHGSRRRAFCFNLAKKY